MKKFLTWMDNFIPKDGRWFLGGSHLTLCLISIAFYNLNRSVYQMILGYAFASITEYIFFKNTNKYKDSKLFDRMFSAASEAAGLIILVKSGHLFFYAIGGSIAVASKYLCRLDEKRHMFNPTNFAIVLSLCIFPQESFNLLSDEYTLSLYPMFHVIILGSLAIWRGKTWQVSLGYFATILVFAGVGSLFYNQSFVYWIGPEIGAIGLIFIFLMITDPKTTPSSFMGKIFYGVCVACLKIVLKKAEILYPQYLALFTITFARGLFIYIKNCRPWQKVPA